jgi:DNA-binding SARP family transcriptional activator
VIASIQARLLGTVVVSNDGNDVDLGPPRQRALFATLAAHTSQVVNREELVDAVWGIDAPATAMNSVYTYVARLRNRLEPTRPQRAPSDLLVSDGSGYMLQLPPDKVDKMRFEGHLKAARHLRRVNELHSAVDELSVGLALWHGTPYGGAVGPFVEAERTHLTELRLNAQEDRGEMLIELGRHSEILGELFGLVRQHPLRERLRYLLMLCYARLGRRADALTEFHDLRTTLADELGVEPGEHIQRFHEQILRPDQSRRPESEQPAFGPVEVGVVGRAVAPAQLSHDTPGFTGRAAELRQMHDLVAAGESAGESVIILVNGGPGIGKTAMAVRFAHELSSRFPDGQLQVNLRGFTDAQPMAPTEALGHLLAALGARSRIPTGLDRQCAFYRSMVARRRMLVLLDDARSVEQTRPLLPGAASCVVIVTSRSGLAGLTVRDGARRLTLDVLPNDDAVTLLSTAIGRPFQVREHPAVQKLVAACCGLPLALRIAASRINTAPSPDRAVTEFTECDLFDRLYVQGDEQSSLRTVFEWSYRALSHDAAQMFRAIGRHGRPDVMLGAAAALVDASPGGARRLLDELVDAHLVQELSPDRFCMNNLLFAYARQLTEAVDGHPLEHR